MARIRKYLIGAVTTLLVVLFLVEPVGREIEPGTPIHFVNDKGDVINVIAPTVVSDRLYSRAESIGSFIYGVVPDKVIMKIFKPKITDDQSFPRERGLGVAKEFFASSEEVEMVHPADVKGASSTLGWAIASVVAGNPGLTKLGQVSATGTLFANGDVGVVGSVLEKAQSLEVLESVITFTPVGQADEAMKAILPANGVTVPIGVSTLEEAVGVLCVISLSKDKLCKRYQSEELSKNQISVLLSPSNHWLCTSFRFSENKELSKVGCSRVFEEGRWLIQLSSVKERY